jgi:small conductance mechanosensitive channel
VSAPAEPCYEQPGTFCNWVYERTDGNEDAATFANWLLDIPLHLLIVVVIAWIAIRLAKRWVERVVTRIIDPGDNAVAERLGKLPLGLPDSITASVRDPRSVARAQSMSAVLTSTTVVAIWTIALVTMLGIVGVELGPLIAGAGIAGVALGFGAQALVKDCIAGFFMLVEDQYGIGDVVDLGEAVGTVEEVSLRTTVLRGPDGTLWHVPNGVVERVGNQSQLWSVAILDVDVAYDTDVARARELLAGAAGDVCRRDDVADLVLEEPQVLGVEALGVDGVTLRLTVKVAPGTQWRMQRLLREHIKAVFDEASVEMPFPQRTVWMRDEPGDTPPGAP